MTDIIPWIWRRTCVCTRCYGDLNKSFGCAHRLFAAPLLSASQRRMKEKTNRRRHHCGANAIVYSARRCCHELWYESLVLFVHYFGEILIGKCLDAVPTITILSANGFLCRVAREVSWNYTQNAVKTFIYNCQRSLHNSRQETRHKKRRKHKTF